MAKTGRKAFGSEESERKIIKQIRLKARVRKGGVKPSLLSVARQLNSEGHETKTGCQWTAQGVKNVLNASHVSGGSAKSLKTKKTSLSTSDFLNKEQLAKVFTAARGVSKEDEMIIAVLAGSGLRASELCALQRRDLGIDDGQAQIDVRRGKGAKQRSIHISGELVSALKSWLWGKVTPRKSSVFTNSRGTSLTYDALYKRIKKIGRLAGMPTLHPHSLRHTFGTLLYHYRKDLFFVKEQLGHSKVETTQIYAKTLTESKLEQMNAFGSDLSTMLSGFEKPDNTSKLECESQGKQ